MRRIILYSLLLVVGMVASQFLNIANAVLLNICTMIALSFIMIHVGLEFDIDKSRPMQYLWDYFVAFTAAALPWILVAAYFVFVMTDTWGTIRTWQESLFLARFAAPTSAGILLSMLAAAGLSATWVFKKVRILVIFDDIDTILLLIPLKIFMVGLKWQLLVVIIPITIFLVLGWRYLHRLRLPTSWPWMLGYAAVITLFCELLYHITGLIDDSSPVQLEVLLPAFVLGMMLRRRTPDTEGSSHSEKEQEAITIVSACFMVLVGLSLPPIQLHSDDGSMSWGILAIHVILITLLSNLGKMFPALCYRKEVSLRERLAVCVSMFPRGEVGAGILVISIVYGISGSITTVAVLSLALNLLATGLFIVIVTRLLRKINNQKQNREDLC
jgi:Kef-type K+ transport system membrane component KefB